MLHPLEIRRMLSVTASFQDGIVTVMGTPVADQINVESGPLGGVSIKSGEDFIPFDTGDQPITGIMVLGGGRADTIGVNLDANDINVTVCGHSGDDLIDARVYASAKVEVHGGYGADTINLQNNTIADAGLVDGMWGDDIINVSNSYGGRGLRVYGGDGNDVIRATAQIHGEGGHVVWGGTGDDTIILANIDLARPVTHVARGGAGDDSINGSDGRDYIFGDDGNDFLRGGEGDDVMFGGAGYDRMYGHQGDDFFDGGLGRDRISAEEGEDMAVEDPLDRVDGVEILI